MKVATSVAITYVKHYVIVVFANGVVVIFDANVVVIFVRDGATVDLNISGNVSRPYIETPHVFIAKVRTKIAMMFIGIPATT